MFVPLVARGRAIGIVVAHDKARPDPRFSDDDRRLAETFALRAAVASTFPRASAATPCAASSKRRSSSGGAWPASSTTRPGRS
jgi:hypothetical protein